MKRHLGLTGALLETVAQQRPELFSRMTIRSIGGPMLMTTPRALRLNALDNVIIASTRSPAGAQPEAGVIARERIPKGHKMAVAPVDAGAPMRKFGQIIGFASRPIAAGEWVHEHNCAVKEFARDYHFGEDARPETIAAVEDQPTFLGFRRANGKVGTRNYLAILTSVNCSATVARLIATEVETVGHARRLPECRRRHRACARHGLRHGAEGRGLRRAHADEWGYAANPNIGATLMVGLGCEVFQIGRMKEEYGVVEGETFQSLTIQATGGTRKTVEAGMERVRAMLPSLDQARREPTPASALTLALCNAADRTAIRASPPIRRLAPRRTFWCATAARRSFLKRRRSMAPSIF